QNLRNRTTNPRRRTGNHRIAFLHHDPLFPLKISYFWRSGFLMSKDLFMLRGLLLNLGNYVLWLRQIFSRPEKHQMYWRETLRQMNDIGIGSLMIVVLISTFIGAVTAVQFSYQLSGTMI